MKEYVGVLEFKEQPKYVPELTDLPLIKLVLQRPQTNHRSLSFIKKERAMIRK